MVGAEECWDGGMAGAATQDNKTSPSMLISFIPFYNRYADECGVI